jgi:hypothetical protein
MLRGFAQMVARYAYLVLVASLLSSGISSDPWLGHAKTATFSEPHVVLLHTLQTKHAAARVQSADPYDSHPLDLHPPVATASFNPDPLRAARLSFAARSNVGPLHVGWHARAPPFPTLQLKS